jgi:hypothetical protein
VTISGSPTNGHAAAFVLSGTNLADILGTAAVNFTSAGTMQATVSTDANALVLSAGRVREVDLTTAVLAGQTLRSGPTSTPNGNTVIYSTEPGGASVTSGFTHGVGPQAMLIVIPVNGAVGLPTVTDAGDESYYNGETGVTVTGTNFGSAQGSGKVYLSPTDDVDDGDRVEQTVTSWSDTSIQFTVVKGSLDLDTGLYLFVVNDGGSSNAVGHAVEIASRPYVRESLIDETGAAVASVTGITMVIYHALPTTASPNPAQVIENVASNGSGAIDQLINRGSLDPGDPVWVVMMKDGTPAKGTVRKITPVYE